MRVGFAFLMVSGLWVVLAFFVLRGGGPTRRDVEMLVGSYIIVAVIALLVDSIIL